MGYVTIAIPSELAGEIDVVITAKRRGYSSRAEFVKDAVRRLLDTLGTGAPAHDLGKGK